MTTEQIIQKIAESHRVSPEQVEADMKAAIQMAMTSTDPAAQALWKQLAPDGDEPSIEAFLRFCAERAAAGEETPV